MNKMKIKINDKQCIYERNSLKQFTIKEASDYLKTRLYINEVLGNYNNLGIIICPLCDSDDQNTVQYFE